MRAPLGDDGSEGLPNIRPYRINEDKDHPPPPPKKKKKKKREGSIFKPYLSSFSITLDPPSTPRTPQIRPNIRPFCSYKKKNEGTYWKTGSTGQGWFFFKIFFPLYDKKKPFMGNKVCLWENVFLYLFFPTCHGKDILELNQAMINLATSFHMKSRGPSGWRKKMKHKKKRKHWRREKKLWQGFVQFLILSKIQKDENTASTVFVGKRQQFQ